MSSKAVFRILKIRFLHDPVPRHLGKNGRRGNGQALRVSLDDRSLRKLHLRNGHCIIDQCIRQNLQAGNRFSHRLIGSLKNIDFINSFRRRQTHTISKRLFGNDVIKLISLPGRELLGVIQIQNVMIRRQNAGTGCNRSGKRTSPCLIDAADQKPFRQHDSAKKVPHRFPLKGAHSRNPFSLKPKLLFSLCLCFFFLRQIDTSSDSIVPHCKAYLSVSRPNSENG